MLGGTPMAVEVTLVFMTTVGMEANGSLSTLLTSLKETQVMIVLQPLLHRQPLEHQQ